ncbi:hypothetical protein O3P69_011679, partial [Scylla paramamosain]
MEEREVWPSCAVVEKVVEMSGLVPVVMKPVWRRILEGRHWVGLALLLPQLECSLRCLFAWINEVSSRVLTAQHTALYTTLDYAFDARETKDWYQPSPITTTAATTITKEEEENRDGEYNKEEEHKDGEYNKVLPILGREITETLFDLLNFSQGLRVRQ